MLVSTRRQVHLALAQFIEVKYSNEIQTLYAVLADHYFKAERLTEAKFFLLNAGDLAIECCAGLEALKFFHKVLEILSMQKKSNKGGVGGLFKKKGDEGKGRRQSNRLDDNHVNVSNTPNDSQAQNEENNKNGNNYNVFSSSTHVMDLSVMFSKASLEEGHVYRQIGEAHYAQSRLSEAREATVKALTFFGEGNYRKRKLTNVAINMRVQLILRIVRKAMGRNNGRLSTMVDDNKKLLIEKAKAWYRLSQISFLENEITYNLYAFFMAIKSAVVLGPSLELSNALSIMIPIMSTMGYSKYSETFSKLTMKMSSELQSKEAVATCNLGRSIQISGDGGLGAAEELLKTAVKTFEIMGDLRLWGEASWLLSKVLNSQGKFVEEQQCVDKNIRIMDVTDDYAAYTGLNVMAANLISVGDILGARILFERAVDKKHFILKKEKARLRMMKRQQVMNAHKKKGGGGIEEVGGLKNPAHSVRGEANAKTKKQKKRIRVGMGENESGETISKIYNVGMTEVLTSSLLLMREKRYKECFQQVEYLINSMNIFKVSDGLFYFWMELVTLGEILIEFIPILMKQKSRDYTILGGGADSAREKSEGEEGENDDGIDDGKDDGRDDDVSIKNLNKMQSASTARDIIGKYMLKTLNCLKTYSNKFAVGKAGYYYILGLHESVIRNKRGKAKFFLEKAIAIGKQFGIFHVVAKSYFEIGMIDRAEGNEREAIGLGGSGGRHGSKYRSKIHSDLTKGEEGGGWGVNENEGENESEEITDYFFTLHKAYLYAKNCSMGSLLQSINKVLAEEVEDGHSLSTKF